MYRAIHLQKNYLLDVENYVTLYVRLGYDCTVVGSASAVMMCGTTMQNMQSTAQHVVVRVVGGSIMIL